MLHLQSITEENLFSSETNFQHEFAWWYLDIIDKKGNGMVCIISKGLPFLPQSAKDRKERFSMNIVCYLEGKEDFYLLQEYPQGEYRCLEYEQAHDTEYRSEMWTVGAHQIKRIIDGDEVELWVSLSSDASNAIGIQGEIHLKGKLCRPKSDLSNVSNKQSSHQWLPITMNCDATISIVRAGEKWEYRGRAYHDSNISTRQLPELGIAYWWWGRISFLDFEYVFYLIYPEEKTDTRPILLSCRMDQDNQFQQEKVVDVQISQKDVSIYGLRTPSIFTIETEQSSTWSIQTQKRLDDSPFYQRYLVLGKHNNGEEGIGYMEHVAPPALGTAWQQPFIRMKTHHKNRPLSIFTPLFTGNKEQRLRYFWQNMRQILFA